MKSVQGLPKRLIVGASLVCLCASRPHVCNYFGPTVYPSFCVTNAWMFKRVAYHFSSPVSDQGKIPAPAFHAFTGTEFTTPEAMHGALWLAVTGEKDVEEGTNIEKKLSAKLKYRQKTPTVTSPMLVVVLDEIDQLMTQNRQVLRKLFEWADAPKSRLVRLLRSIITCACVVHAPGPAKACVPCILAHGCKPCLLLSYFPRARRVRHALKYYPHDAVMPNVGYALKPSQPNPLWAIDASHSKRRPNIDTHVFASRRLVPRCWWG